MKKRNWLLGGAVGFLALQLVRPRIASPPITADLAAPADVKAILRTSCYGCHSNETSVPLFDEVVPAYWLVAHDVMEGRKHLNFSEIGGLPVAQQNGKIFEAVNHVALGAMPPTAYLLVHRGAKVTAEELGTLRAWAATLALPPKNDARGADAELERSRAKPRGPVRPSPNGIELPAEYASWSPISASDRWDNGQLRQILGNPIAVRAIRDGHTNPWPDGTTFAKVAWQAVREAMVLRAGEFWQVEFMIRDRARYSETEGWGWARWRGTELEPYGKGADVARECIDCHRPVKARDLVFTVPFARDAAPVLDQRPITTIVDPAAKTLAILYGASDGNRTLVTWTEREDPTWFGARVPAARKSIVPAEGAMTSAHAPVTP